MHVYARHHSKFSLPCGDRGLPSPGHRIMKIHALSERQATGPFPFESCFHNFLTWKSYCTKKKKKNDDMPGSRIRTYAMTQPEVCPKSPHPFISSTKSTLDGTEKAPYAVRHHDDNIDNFSKQHADGSTTTIIRRNLRSCSSRYHPSDKPAIFWPCQTLPNQLNPEDFSDLLKSCLGASGRTMPRLFIFS